MGTVFTVASAKGGVGKTTTTAALGTTLAAAGNDVVVVDGDIGMANLATVLGLDPGGPTLHAVLSGDAAVEDATYEGPAGLAVVPGSTDIDDFREADATDLGAVVEELREYDYVFIDTGAGLSHDNALPLGLADEVLLVSSPEPPALIDTDKTRQLADRLDANVRGLVLTRVTENVTFEVPDQVNLEIPVLARVPYDEAVITSFAARNPLCTHAPESAASAAYRALAEELTGESIPDPSPESADSGGPDEDAAAGAAKGVADVDAADEGVDGEATDETADVDADDASAVTGFVDDEADVEHDLAGDADFTDSVADASDDAPGTADSESSEGAIDTGVANALERAESTVGGDADAADQTGDAVDPADVDPADLVQEAERHAADAADQPDGEYQTVLGDEDDGDGEAGDDRAAADEGADAEETEEEERGGFFRRLLGG